MKLHWTLRHSGGKTERKDASTQTPDVWLGDSSRALVLELHKIMQEGVVVSTPKSPPPPPVIARVKVAPKVGPQLSFLAELKRVQECRQKGK